MDRTTATLGSNPHVLLVSEDRGTIIVLRALLERLGAQVHVARTPLEGRMMLDHRFHWVVMDPALDVQERIGLMNHAAALRLGTEFVVMSEMRDVEGVLEVMGYSMAG